MSWTCLLGWLRFTVSNTTAEEAMSLVGGDWQAQALRQRCYRLCGAQKRARNDSFDWQHSQPLGQLPSLSCAFGSERCVRSLPGGLAVAHNVDRFIHNIWYFSSFGGHSRPEGKMTSKE